jgi:hypothetical protein
VQEPKPVKIRKAGPGRFLVPLGREKRNYANPQLCKNPEGSLAEGFLFFGEPPEVT